jgi:hypothetical protein
MTQRFEAFKAHIFLKDQESFLNENEIQRQAAHRKL